MFKCFLEWCNQGISLGDFIGLAFVTAFVDMARDIALIEPNPGDWGGWVTYLIEQLEAEAQRRGKRTGFVEILMSLQHNLYK